MYVTRSVTLCHVIYSVRYYSRFHVNAVGLGTYYPRIRGSACIYIEIYGLHKAAAMILSLYTPDKNVSNFSLLPFSWGHGSEYGQGDRHHYSSQCYNLEFGLCSYFLVSSILSKIVGFFYFVNPRSWSWQFPNSALRKTDLFPLSGTNIPTQTPEKELDSINGQRRKNYNLTGFPFIVSLTMGRVSQKSPASRDLTVVSGT